MDKNFFSKSIIFTIKIPEGIKTYKDNRLFIPSDEYKMKFYLINKATVKEGLNFIIKKGLILPEISGLEIASLCNDFNFLRSGESIYSFYVVGERIITSSVQRDKKIVSFDDDLNSQMGKGYLMALDIIV